MILWMQLLQLVTSKTPSEAPAQKTLMYLTDGKVSGRTLSLSDGERIVVLSGKT